MYTIVGGIMKDFKKLLDENNIKYIEDEYLKKYTTFKVGGKADLIVFPDNVDDIQIIIRTLRDCGIRYLVLGNGSNILFTDDGFRGVIIRIYDNFSAFRVKGNKVVAQSGALLEDIFKKAAMHSLTGGEFACGIPGTVGGAIVMNAGAYDGEMKKIVKNVTVLDKHSEIKVYSNEEMGFGYRKSNVLKDHMIVLEVEFELEKGDLKEIWDRIDELTIKRWSKQPLTMPSAGSTFKRPEGYYAGKLIQDTGLKGIKYKGAMVSSKHSGFVVNYDNATYQDIKTLIKIIQNKVLYEQGVHLETEVKIIESNI